MASSKTSHPELGSSKLKKKAHIILTEENPILAVIRKGEERKCGGEEEKTALTWSKA